MSLSNQQIATIRALIEHSQVTIPTLEDDLLDHLCCDVEERMSGGRAFAEAVGESLKSLAPNGLIEIEKETVFLLNYNKYMYMKKLTFIIGLLCTVAMAAGCILGLLKYSMGHMIFGLAAFVFVIVFVPLDAIRYFRSTADVWSEKLLYIFSTSSSIILATGVLARIMQLPGANEMIILGLIIFALGFLPFQLYKMFRNSFSRMG